MDASAPQWLVALEASGVSAAIRQSTWAYPLANVVHVTAIAVFAGAVAVLDLILLGVLRPAGRAALLAGANRWAVGLLVLVLVSGLVLFLAEASHVALNRVFQIKLGLIGLAALNALLTGRRALALISGLPDAAPVPAAARSAAFISIGLWVAVVALGRYIAYH